MIICRKSEQPLPAAVRYRLTVNRTPSLVTGLFAAFTIFAISMIIPIAHAADAPPPRFRVIAIAERGGIHAPYVEAAKKWLDQLAADENFTIDYIENADKIDDAFLARYQLFIQLNFPPYTWPPTAQAAFVKYISQ